MWHKEQIVRVSDMPLVPEGATPFVVGALAWPGAESGVLEGTLQARGGPTIKVVSTHKAEIPSVKPITKELS